MGHNCPRLPSGSVSTPETGRVPALLPRLQLALLPLWLVRIVAALIFTLVTIATVALFTLLHHPISTNRLARFWGKSIKQSKHYLYTWIWFKINKLWNLITKGERIIWWIQKAELGISKSEDLNSILTVAQSLTSNVALGKSLPFWGGPQFLNLYSEEIWHYGPL